MNSTTLRGIFPDSKPVHRRNFIRENVKQIKQMQGILQDAGIIQPKSSKEDRYRNAPKNSTNTQINLKNHSSHTIKRSSSQDSTLNNKRQVEKLKFDSKFRRNIKTDKNSNERFTHRSMQTEKTDDVNKLYEQGVIKYARPSAFRSKRFARGRGQGDMENLNEGMGSLDISDSKDGRDFVRENMKNIKPKYVKAQPKKAPPTNYEIGVVPKYLRERKEDEEAVEENEDCPPGYVLLPEEDRKITLRNLRQSYADRIQELNTMPVRSDTLRMRKRKMEIEEELKKIDGGIKIFQRPKVYVKINE